MTIAEALNVSDRTISFRDAEVLLAAVLDCDRSHLHTHGEQVLTPAQEEAYQSSLTRRENNEPVAHIVGYKEFYGRRFIADKRALIPRPETEGAVERALAWAVPYFQSHLKATGKPCPLRILELGTGGGPIAISLALELSAQSIPATIIATDIAPEALEQAQENWQILGKGSRTDLVVLKCIEADLFDHSSITTRPFDLIIANLPYVETTWQVETGAQPDVVFFEPDVALFGGADGLDIYRRFFAEAPTHLEAGGAVIIEYGDTQTTAITPLATAAFPDKLCTVHQDYAGLDRILELLPAKK
ncbi:MAG: peptide chain release factor N(5)-glutamine methyltransferase [Candidatus Paceibacterota bacterium]